MIAYRFLNRKTIPVFFVYFNWVLLTVYSLKVCAQNKDVYKNQSLPAYDRAANLVSQLTLEEKNFFVRLPEQSDTTIEDTGL